MAMFIINKQWLHVIVFTALSLFSLVFLLATKPYKERSDNDIFVLNDLINLMCSYLIIQINDLRSEPPTSEHIGECIVVLLYFSWSCNSLIILYLFFKHAIRKARRYYFQKLRWKITCLRPTKAALSTGNSVFAS